MVYTEIQQTPQEECKDDFIWIPVQNKEHKKKCLLPHISAMPSPENHNHNHVDTQSKQTNKNQVDNNLEYPEPLYYPPV